MPDDTSILDAALQYAGRGWPVFRLSSSKVPLKGTHGHLDATTDPTLIRTWLEHERRPLCLGLACGPIVVLDADGPGGLAQLTELARPHGGLPRTLVARTARGFHFYYRAGTDDLRTLNGPRAAKGDDGLDIKAHGGYVVLPPSVNRRTGFRYAWVEPQAPIAELPAWLAAWVRERGGRRADRGAGTSGPAVNLGPRPAWLAGAGDAGGDLSARALAMLDAERMTLDELLTHLKRIPASIGNQDWFRVGCMIHDWSSADDGLAIFKAWSRTSTRHEWSEAEPSCEREWANMSKPKQGKEKVHVGSLPIEAAKYPPPEAQQALASGGKVNGFHAEAAHSGPLAVQGVGPLGESWLGGGISGEFPVGRTGAGGFAAGAGTIQRVAWVDMDEDGRPKATCTNAAIAIAGLGVTCSKDIFHDRLNVGGHFVRQWAGDLTDEAVLMLRLHIKRYFRFDPGEKNTRDAAVQLCLENQYDPLLNYLDGLKWDGRERAARWLTDYMGADDSALTREFARLTLMAAVRRAYHPGAKFDQILVMEGPEGRGKSTALRILAGEGNYSDARILGTSDREQLEATAGVWIHEIAELAGMKRAEVEAVKVFASRTVDRARPAYGRFRVDRPRRCIFIATTNLRTYLKSDTGDRRFWPVTTGRIKVEELTRDRDQLWAEAVHRIKAGESIALDPKWWGEAGKLQASRQELDPWHDDVRAQLDKKGSNDTSVSEVLTDILHLELARIGQIEQNRAARVLRMLGFERYQKNELNVRTWRYRRGRGDSGCEW